MKIAKLYLILVAFGLSLPNAHSQRLRIMSYNIHHGADREETNTLDAMGQFIKESKADLIGLQEVDSVCTRSGNVDQMKRLAEITGMHYAFVQHFPYQGGAYGVGVLSKYPIVHVERKKLQLVKEGQNGNSVSMIFATVKLPNQKDVLFVTAHYSAFDKATRQSQVRETLAYLSEITLPVILTGDLNTTPDTDEIKQLQQHFSLLDSALTPTFPETSPTKKIDYILTTPHLIRRVINISTPMVRYSDHLPLLAHVKLK